jgi:hypothetical protein
MGRLFILSLVMNMVTTATAGAHDSDPVVGICSGSKEFYKDMSCCGGRADLQSVCMSKEITPAEMAYVPPLPAIVPGKKPKILLGYDMWSPYVYINDAGDLTGFGPEFIKLMQKSTHPTCSWMDIRMVQDVWARCWNDLRGEGSTIHPGNPWNTDTMGAGPNYGLYHGGITYTHLKGVRPRMGEFSYAITKASAQPSGVLVKLDANGKPMVSPKSDLAGMKIIDVANYAPTIDTFALVQNWCNDGALFSTNVEFISPPQDGNRAAMKLFKERSDVYLMYVYSDQAYDCAGASFKNDCAGWEGLGTEYAYIHTGLDPNINGTTISFHKMNSGVNEALNPCIQAVMETRDYKNLCNTPERPPVQMSTNMRKCFPNSYWTAEEIAANPAHAWHSKQHQRTDSLSCKDGYCRCSEVPSQ